MGKTRHDKYEGKTQKHGVEIRMRGRQAKLVSELRDGEADLSDWDMEELIRGYRRAKNGTFAGRPPLVVPREVHDELAKRVKSQVAHELRGLVAEKVVPVMRKILEGEVDPADAPGLRLQMQVAQDLLDRFVVSKSEKIEIAGTMKHENIIESVTIDRSLDDGEDDIVDAEIVEEEEDLGDWDDEEWE